MSNKLAVAMMMMGAALALQGCGNSVPATAMVTTIDRTCTIVEKTKLTGVDGKELPGSGEEIRRYEGECHEIDDWDEVKRGRGMNLDGKAEIHLVYAGPDGKQHNSSVRVTGQDSEFYDLKAGDSVEVRLNPDKPEQVWFS